VQRWAGVGARQIKIYGGLPPALVSVVAEEAHRRGLTVTGHVPTGMDARQFVEAGADQFTHIGYAVPPMRTPGAEGRPATLDLASAEAQAALRFFRERGTVIEPTLARNEQHAHPRDSGWAGFEPGVSRAPAPLREVLESTGAPANIAARAMASHRRLLEVTGALHRAGVPLIAGSDLSVPGHSLHRELEKLVEAGLSPMEAIRAATAVPASVFGMDAEVGTIEPGKRADLVLVDGDPLTRIADVRRVHAVITAGRLFDPAPLWRSTGFEPGAE
jgi:imidazolonepropionase-like amidohydrolase